MITVNKPKLRELQERINYTFKNKDLLIQSLTTPFLANKIETPSYEILETIGDCVIKLILTLKLYNNGINEPSKITKIKAVLESNEGLRKIANSITLGDYVLKPEDQRIQDTKILADVFETLCGAILIDSDRDIKIVERKIITPFFQNIEELINEKSLFSKNALLELLQEKFRTSVIIKADYEKFGVEHDPVWIAKNPKVLEKDTNRVLLEIEENIESDKFSRKKDTEKDLYFKIMNYLEEKEFS